MELSNTVWSRTFQKQNHIDSISLMVYDIFFFHFLKLHN